MLRAGGVGIVKLDKTELGGRPEDNLLGQPGEVHHADAGRRLVFEDKVAVGDGVHAVAADLAEAKLFGHKLAVDIIGDAGQGPAAQGHDVGALQAVAEAVDIPLEHLEIGQQVVGQQHRLRRLQMGIAGHDHLFVGFGQADKRPLQLLRSD